VTININNNNNNNKNSKILLNNQQQQQSDHHHHQQLQPYPLRTIVNNLRGADSDTKCEEEEEDGGGEEMACNRCKELLLSGQQQHNKADSCKNNRLSTSRSSLPNKAKNVRGRKNGCVNLAFVDSTTEASSWYQPRLSRHLAVKILADCPVGSFVVRQSQTHSGGGCLALTVRVPRSLGDGSSPVLHYLVLITEEGFRIKGFAKVFPSLSGLVVHHSVMKESLPCRLLIEDDTAGGGGGGNSGGESDRESDFADLDSDPEYPGLIIRLREQLSL
jgi:hypothetical protein